MKTIYLISGLGADYRVFQHLNFDGFNIQHVQWILPTKNESIEDYATRLRTQIQSENPIIIGLSFGGMMATEIGKQIKTEKVIILASAKTRKEIPWYFRLGGDLYLDKLIPTSFMRKSNFVGDWIFGITNKEERKLLDAILNDTDPVFVKWAISQVLRWRNLIRLQGLIHIHGTSDRIFPFNYDSSDIQVKNGGHFMTINKAEEISASLRKILSE